MYKKLIINLHGIGIPDRPLGPGETNSIIDVNLLEYVLDLVTRYSMLITVDDGNKSDVELILPNLKKRNLKASFFIPAAKIGKKGYLARNDILKLQQEGMTIGSHGMDHVNWRNLNNPQLERELVDSKQILEHIIGDEISDAACPFGAYDRRVLVFLKKAGYQKIYTSDKGYANLGNWIISRNSLSSDDTVESVNKLFENGFSSFDQSLISLKNCIKRIR